MHKFFICNQSEIELKLKTLHKTGISEDGWTHYYLDTLSDEKWHLTSFNSEYHGGGVRVLKRIPEPTIEALIDIAMTSLDTNDIVGKHYNDILKDADYFRSISQKAKDILNKL